MRRTIFVPRWLRPRRRTIWLVFGIAAAAMLLVHTRSVVAAPGDTERLSSDSGGVQGNGASAGPAMSQDGRYVAFSSTASNLVAGDSNGVEDIFVRDRQAGTTERVSIGAGGVQSNGGTSNDADMSADGRFVAFASAASNLVAGDTNSKTDIFIRDRQTGTTERVSVDSVGGQSNGVSFSPRLSSDGRYVAFCSDASNLVSGDANGTMDAFMHDRQTGTTVRVSVATAGTEGNGQSCANSGAAISGDGRYVAFPSVATNLVAGDTNSSNDVFVRDTLSNSTERVSVDSSGAAGVGTSAWPNVSGDGRYVAFSSTAPLVSGDTNGTWDIFLRDRVAGTTERVSVNSSGGQANANSGYAAMSPDARYIAFHSYASNLSTCDTNGISDVFLRDRQSATTVLVTVDSTGVQGTGPNVEIAKLSTSAVQGDGTVYVAFFAGMTNLVAGDTNGVTDAFIHRNGGPSDTCGLPPTPTYTPTSTSTPTSTATPTATVTPGSPPSVGGIAEAVDPAALPSPTAAASGNDRTMYELAGVVGVLAGVAGAGALWRRRKVR